MQEDPRPGQSGRQFVVRRAILALSLGGHPSTLTIRELSRQFGDGAAVEQAISSLRECGLVEIGGRRSQSLWPTSAAREAHRLEAW
jgi:DNA-binding transcriptional ArsR family regulator